MELMHLGLRTFRDHKFRHCFQDTLNPLCDCVSKYFFLPWASFHSLDQTLQNQIRNISEQILSHGGD